jgi:hypothetical protein
MITCNNTMPPKIIFHSVLLGLALFILNPVSLVYAAEEIDAYCVVPTSAVPHASTVPLTIKFGDSDKSNNFIVQGPFKVLRYENGKAIIVDVQRGNEKDEKGKENAEKPTLTFSVQLSPKHKLPAPATESVTFTYFVKHKEGKRGELFTTEKEQQVDCAFVVQHESEEPTTPSGGNGGDDTEKSITPSDLGVEDTGILPTSRFYFLKEWRRNISRLFTFNAVSEAELELTITNEKAAEMLVVEKEHPDDTDAQVNALENYTKAQENLRMRLIDLEETSKNPRVEKLLKKLDEQTLKHSRMLEQVRGRYDTDPYVEDANVVNPQATRDNHLQGAMDILQKKIQEVVVAGAEKDVHIEQKAQEQITSAEAALGELESRLAEFTTPQSAAISAKTGPIRLDPTPARISTNMTIERQTPKRDFGDRMKAGLDQAGGMLANGKAHLIRAKESFTAGKFGEAFGEARAGEMLAINGSQVLSGILRPDHGGLEDGAQTPLPKTGRDADAPRIEEGVKSVAPPMPNVPVPLVPTTIKGEEKIAPTRQETILQPTQEVMIVPPPQPRQATELQGAITPAAVTTQTKNTNDVVSGYNFTVSGKVSDMTNAPAMTDGIPLVGVTVSASGPLALTTQTQSNGMFVLTFRNAPVGNYKVCVTLPSGFTAPSAGDPPCEEVVVELLADGTTLVFTNKGNKAYYTGTQFNFYAIRSNLPLGR